MSTMHWAGALAGAAAVVAAASTGAEAFELRAGIATHDTDILNDKKQSEEQGPNIPLEIVSEPVKALSLIWSPRLTAGGSINTQGDTSYGGVGLLWRTPDFGDRFYGELGLGYVIHNGETQIPDISPANTPAENQRLQQLDAEKIEFGSEDLIRAALGVGMRVSDRHAVELFYEHLSHGQILGEGSNEALDAFGARWAIRFGE